MKSGDKDCDDRPKRASGGAINHKSGSGKQFIGTAKDGSTAVRNIGKSMRESSASSVYGMPLFSAAKGKS